MTDHRILCGDSLHVLPTLDAESVDAIVCDPPYGLSFMGKEWDHGVPGEAFWREALRVAKPGAHLLAFGGSRTYHRLACAIEDAGWEIRDCLSWLYGSGFPKSHDVSKAMDKVAGAERDVVSVRKQQGNGGSPRASRHHLDTGSGKTVDGRNTVGATAYREKGEFAITAPATDLARQWQGWGTALKPAWEPIIVARKPLVGTVAANVAQYGTGAINVDATRIAGPPTAHGGPRTRPVHEGGQQVGIEDFCEHPSGRWPANVVLDEEAAAMLDAQTGELGLSKGGGMNRDGQWNTVFQKHIGHDKVQNVGYGDTGGASRFFFVAREGQCDNVNDAELTSSPAAPAADSALGLASPSHSHANSQVGQACTADCTDSTRHQNHVSSAEQTVSTDITPTTPTCCGLCGSVLPVTATSTSQASVARVEDASDPVSGTRFLYSPKASRREREAGLEGMPTKSMRDGAANHTPRSLQVFEQHGKLGSPAANHHPTVKPIALMRWLCRLVTPPNGLVLDPFTGSGSTGCAAVLEGFRFVGIEREPEYAAIAEKRIAHWAGQVETPEPSLFDG